MEIEFNTGGPVGKPDPGKPAARKEPTPPVREDASFQTDALERKLKDLPPLRPERVERAKGLLTGSGKYPPDEMLVGIANLLAMHM
jgi:hypothetical protein